MTVFIKGSKKARLLFWIAALLLVCGCFVDRSYRSADLKTLRDFTGSRQYQKKVGVMALSNTAVFNNKQAAEPFMAAFLSGITATATGTFLAIPGKADVPSFLWDPPRLPDGELEVFTLSRLARQEGMNTVVTPILMDIRVRKENTGFWFFKGVSHSLQIQTAAALYDAITGARLALKILIDDVEIDAYQADTILSGKEVTVDELIEVAEEMGEALGEKMGAAIKKTVWQISIVAVEEGTCVIAAGSEAGVTAGDRFSILDGSEVVTGLNGQRFIVPGPKTGEMTITRVTPDKAYGTPESGELPPVGSIVVVGE